MHNPIFPRDPTDIRPDNTFTMCDTEEQNSLFGRYSECTNMLCSNTLIAQTENSRDFNLSSLQL